MKARRLLLPLPLFLLMMSCSPEAITSDDNSDREAVCELYRTNKISKDAALQQLGLADEEGGPTMDGRIESDEQIYDLCDPAAAKDRGDVEDGV